MSRVVLETEVKRRKIAQELFSAATLGIDADEADTSAWDVKEAAQDSMDLLTEVNQEKYAALPVYIREKNEDIKRYLPALTTAYQLATDFLLPTGSGSVDRWMNPITYDFPHAELDSRRLNIESILSVADLLSDPSSIQYDSPLSEPNRDVRFRLRHYIKLRLGHPDAFTACLSGNQIKLLRGLEEYWQRTDRSAVALRTGVQEKIVVVEGYLRNAIAEYERDLAELESAPFIQAAVGGPELAALFENKRQRDIEDLRVEIEILRNEWGRLRRVNAGVGAPNPTPWYAAALNALTSVFSVFSSLQRKRESPALPMDVSVIGKTWPAAVAAWDRGILHLQPRACEQFARATEMLVRVYESIVMRTMESITRQAFSVACLAPLEAARSLIAGSPRKVAIRAACHRVFGVMTEHVRSLKPQMLKTRASLRAEDLHSRLGADMVLLDAHDERRLCARQLCIAKIWSHGTHRFEPPPLVERAEDIVAPGRGMFQSPHPALLRATMEAQREATQTVAQSVVWRELYDVAVLDFTVANPRYLASKFALSAYIVEILSGDPENPAFASVQAAGEIMKHLERTVNKCIEYAAPTREYVVRWASHYIAAWYSAVEDFCMADVAISVPTQQFNLIGYIPPRPDAAVVVEEGEEEGEEEEDDDEVPSDTGIASARPVGAVLPPRRALPAPADIIAAVPEEFDALRARDAQIRYMTRVQRIIQFAEEMHLHAAFRALGGTLHGQFVSAARAASKSLKEASRLLREAFQERLANYVSTTDEPSLLLPNYASAEYAAFRDLQMLPGMDYAAILDGVADQLANLEQLWFVLYRRVVDDRGNVPDIFEQLATAWSLVPYMLYESVPERDTLLRDSNLRYSDDTRAALSASGVWSLQTRSESVALRDGALLFYEPYAFYRIADRWLLGHQLLMPETVHFAARVSPLRHPHSIGIALKTEMLYGPALKRALNEMGPGSDTAPSSAAAGVVGIVALASTLLARAYRGYFEAGEAAAAANVPARPIFQALASLVSTNANVENLLDNNPVTRYLDLTMISKRIWYMKNRQQMAHGALIIDAVSCVLALIPAIRAFSLWREFRGREEKLYVGRHGTILLQRQGPWRRSSAVMYGIWTGAVLTTVGYLVSPTVVLGVSIAKWVLPVLAALYAQWKHASVGSKHSYLGLLGTIFQIAGAIRPIFSITGIPWAYAIIRTLVDQMPASVGSWLAGADPTALAQLAGGGLYAHSSWDVIALLLRDLQAKPTEPGWDGFWEWLGAFSRGVGAGVLGTVPLIA